MAEADASIPRIGFLGLAPEFSGVEALRAGLRDLGYIDGAAGEHSNCKWLHDTLRAVATMAHF